jgi:hydrogenase expression/formation protein HypC
MQVIETHEFHAVCLDGNQQHKVDTTLLGQPEPGTWLLVFLGAAREALDEPTALAMRDAVNAVNQVMSGESQIDHLFGDLINRQPQIPDHLKPLVKKEA